MSGSDYLLELMERAFLLQQKRVWSLETLLKLERGQILLEASAADKQALTDHLNSNLRVAHERLNSVAAAAGYESSVAKLLDPTSVLGYAPAQITATVQKTIEQIDMAERNAGTHNLAAMFRELSIQHDPYFEDVNEKVRTDVEFYRACRDFNLSSPADKPESDNS